MPTKTRIVMVLNDGSRLMGQNAREYIREQSRPPYLPVDWKDLPQWRKLAWLGRYLPKVKKLTMFRESKRTKISRSKYWAYLLKLGYSMPRKKKPRARQHHPEVMNWAQMYRGEHLPIGNIPIVPPRIRPQVPNRQEA